MSIMVNKPEHCPRFDWCNANLCPLDPLLHKRRYYKEELCFYVREFAKIQSGKARQEPNEIDEAIIEMAEKHFQLICKIGGTKYRYKLNRASKSTSKKNTINIQRDQANLGGPVTENKGSRTEETKAA